MTVWSGAALAVLAVAVLGLVLTWRLTIPRGERIRLIAEIATAAATAVIAIAAFGLFRYQYAEMFAAARAAVSVQPMQPPLLGKAKEGDYIVLWLDATNVSQHAMEGLSITYSHFDGEDWLGSLPWGDERAQAIGPTYLKGTAHMPGRLGTYTRANPMAWLDQGRSLYFAVRAEWKDPSGIPRCKMVYIAISKLMLGFSPEGPRPVMALAVPRLPDGMKGPEGKLSRCD